MNRKNCFDVIGGDTIQMVKTKEYLERIYGINIKIGFSEDDIVNYNPNIVHIFNIQTVDETYEYVRLCKKYGKKIVISSIYWDLIYAKIVSAIWSKKLKTFNPKGKLSSLLMRILENDFARNGLISLFKILLRYKERQNIYKIRKIIELADIILPNSDEEAEIIQRHFGTKIKYKVVFNAVDSIFLNDGTHRQIDNSSNIKLLTVGRIESYKNQYNVMRALALLHKKGYNNLSYTLVGKIIDYKYFHFIKKFSEKFKISLSFIEEVDHRSLPSIYKNHHIHVLPSFRESPGLASLEAIASGCFAIVSKYPYAPITSYFSEYLNTLVYICDPFKPTSIADAVENTILAIKQRKSIDLNLNKFEFFWERTAQQTYEAYMCLL
ncbi:MAG: glycosyltransferase family 4 protein [Elusimicrobiota bacterium]|nr:glycosyltransferase family 4 protein [Endomicrobiia bacterium]MDW8166588.1 glycosyltransferase family 4 protein [Elusimicrobiota bacterium]